VFPLLDEFDNLLSALKKLMIDYVQLLVSIAVRVKVKWYSFINLVHLDVSVDFR
jgi:hypothetical protein